MIPTKTPPPEVKRWETIPFNYVVSGVAGGSAFWATSLFSTTIHEFGHLWAARALDVPVYELSVGNSNNGPLKKMGIWENTWHLQGSNPIKFQINVLTPFHGCVLRGRTSCPWKTVMISGAGPGLQMLTLTAPYYFSRKYIQKCREEERPVNPLIFGIYVGSAFGILAAFGNLLPIHKSLDGYKCYRELCAIKDRNTLL